jgi:transcriptional regulator GlxA family with amidase domain
VIHLARYYSAAKGGSGQREASGSAASSAQRVREATVNIAIKHMREHLAEPLRIEQISASVFLSPDHFSKVFAAVLGQSPNDYLRQMRIEEAKSLLRSTDMPITTVATTVGFNQPAYFTRVFRVLVGCTPREYRRTQQRTVAAQNAA